MFSADAEQGAEPAAEAPAEAEATNEAPEATSEGPDLSWLPEAYRKDEGPDLDGFKAHYEDIAAQNAQFQEAVGEVPESYEFDVPEDLDFGDLDLPDDFTVQIAKDDEALAPVFAELNDVMKKHNMPASAAKEMMGLVGKMEAARFSKAYAAAKDEMKALGPTAEARVSSVQRLLEARLPAELIPGITGATTTAAGVKALEKLLAPRGVGSPTPHPPTQQETSPFARRYAKTGAQG